MVTSTFLTTPKGKRAFRMIKPPQVLLVAAALLGCATQEQKSAAVDDWGDCVRSAVERVDDGKTDPMSVADGISAMCAAFYDKVRQSQIKVRQYSGTHKGPRRKPQRRRIAHDCFGNS